MKKFFKMPTDKAGIINGPRRRMTPEITLK